MYSEAWEGSKPPEGFDLPFCFVLFAFFYTRSHVSQTGFYNPPAYTFQVPELQAGATGSGFNNARVEPKASCMYVKEVLYRLQLAFRF